VLRAGRAEMPAHEWALDAKGVVATHDVDQWVEERIHPGTAIQAPPRKPDDEVPVATQSHRMDERKAKSAEKMQEIRELRPIVVIKPADASPAQESADLARTNQAPQRDAAKSVVEQTLLMFPCCEFLD
jgi:hypothetical protein